MYRLTLFLSLILLAVSAQATGWHGLANDAGTGQFLVHTQGGWQPGLLLNTHIKVDVTGPMAEVTLTQRFKNPSHHYVEGVYVYPLPDNAALYGMTLRIGKRLIKGEVHEKHEAHRIYEQAKRQGKNAALVKQLDPGVFTTSVANIPPGQAINVTLTYTQVIKRDGANFSLRLPLTITPRYAPANSAESLRPAAALMPTSIKKAANATRQMANKQLTATLKVTLDPGLPISGLSSPERQLRIVRQGSRYQVITASETVPMDQDFVLNWAIQPQAHTTSAFFTQTVNGKHYGLLMMMPPKPTAEHHRLPKEQILVIDHSGSMGGDRIRQARKSAKFALRHLHHDDRFNVVIFNHRTTTLFTQPVPATSANIQQALHFVSQMDARGGTEILPAMKVALAMDRAPEYVHQIILATDAAVTNGQALLQLVHNQLGNARLFTVGIGDAPNAALLNSLAQFGHGVATLIHTPKQVTPKMKRLLRRISQPMLTDIQLHFPAGVDAKLTPAQLPDLYLGQPLIVAARLNHFPKEITITGKQPAPWKRIIHLETNGNHKGVARLWAQQRIGELMDNITQGASLSAIRPKVVNIALRHQLVTRFTSFVAVDKTPVRDQSTPLEKDVLTPRLPKDMQTRARHFPDTALDTWHELGIAALLALLACLLLFASTLIKQEATHDIH